MTHRVPDRRQRDCVAGPQPSVTRLHSEVVVFRDLPGSREWRVVRLRAPFAESVPDRVEVPPATYGTGVKPQFGLLIQLLNFFRAQTADALF
jgi:hypothetical protein